MKTHTLPAGTVLYHGTNRPESFTLPDAPAWFCTERLEACRWAGWKTIPNPGKRRVLTFTLGRDVVLLDTVDRKDWVAMCLALCGEDEPIIFDAALAVQRAGHNGWYGRKEIMLVDTTILTFVRATTVRKNIPSF